jgi:hypothetical protein
MFCRKWLSDYNISSNTDTATIKFRIIHNIICVFVLFQVTVLYVLNFASSDYFFSIFKLLLTLETSMICLKIIVWIML